MKMIASLMIAAATLAAAAPASAQTRLKWAHVYETSEPYHRWSVWAADEFKKRTNGKYEIQVFPALLHPKSMEMSLISTSASWM